MTIRSVMFIVIVYLIIYRRSNWIEYMQVRFSSWMPWGQYLVLDTDYDSYTSKKVPTINSVTNFFVILIDIWDYMKMYAWLCISSEKDRWLSDFCPLIQSCTHAPTTGSGGQNVCGSCHAKSKWSFSFCKRAELPLNVKHVDKKPAC